MCNPAAIFASSVAAAGAKAYTGYQAAKANAKATEDYQGRVGESMVNQHKLNLSNSLANQNADNLRASRDRSAIIKRASLAQSLARTSMLESGISGNTYDSVIADYDAKEAELLHAASLNEDLAANRYRREREMAREATKARLVSNYRPINQPSVGAAVLEFAGDSLQAAGSYYAATADKP